MRHLLACLLLVCLALPAFAEDAPATKEAKVVDLATVAAKWPAPSADAAFSFEMVVLLGEAPMGSFELAVAPHEVDGKVAGWAFRERLALELGAREAEGTHSFQFSSDLRPLAGAATQNFEGTPLAQSFTTKDGTTKVVHKPEGGEAKTFDVKSAPWMLPGKPGLFMLARFTPLERMTVRGTSFSSTDDEGPTTDFSVEVNPDTHYEGRKVLQLVGTRRNERLEVMVDPKTRDILRVRMTKTDSAMVMTMMPKAEAPAQDDIFAREPKNASEASAHVLYAITIKDRELIEKSFHWEEMYGHAKKLLEAAQQPGPTLDAWHKATLDQLSAGDIPGGVTPDQVKAWLRGTLAKAAVQDSPEGYKVIVWPQGQTRIVAVMAEKDGVWKAIGVRTMGG